MMDIKNIYKYLEGLVKIPENDAEEFWKLRRSIIVQKIEYFKQNKEFKILIEKD